MSHRPFTHRSLFHWPDHCLGSDLTPPMEALSTSMTMTSLHLRYGCTWTLALTSHVCSASFPPTALLSYSGDVTFKLLPRCLYSIRPKITAFISSLSQIIIFVFWFGRSLALSLALGFFLLMARGKWTTCFATNTKKGEHQSRVFPFHLTGVYRYLY